MGNIGSILLSHRGHRGNIGSILPSHRGALGEKKGGGHRGTRLIPTKQGSPQRVSKCNSYTP